ncbi:MAG: chloride channel protein [candidate division WOR-3 bacterium]
MTSILTIASGGPARKEGPVIFASGAMGSWLAKLLRLSEKERSILTVCGAGGGLGAVFRAPVGGALYAAEVLYRRADGEKMHGLPLQADSDKSIGERNHEKKTGTGKSVRATRLANSTEEVHYNETEE